MTDFSTRALTLVKQIETKLKEITFQGKSLLAATH